MYKRQRQDRSREAAPDRDSGGGIPRLYIHDFAVNDARVDWHDTVPPEPVTTVFGPVSIRVAELNTLPDRAGRQEVVISTESEGNLRWSGSLHLNPLMSVGHAAISGSHFPLASRYIRHDTGLDIVDGEVDIDFDYSIAIDQDGQLHAAVDNLELLLAGLRVSTFHGQRNDTIAPREFLGIPRIELSGGALRWPEQEVSAENFAVSGARLDLVRLADGQFDFATAEPSATTTAEDPVTDDEGSPPAPTGSPWSLALDRFTLADSRIALCDRSVDPVADTSVYDITLEILTVSNTTGT